MHSIEGKKERRNSADNKAYRRHREGTIAPVQGHHGRVFYHQMKGDYYCYETLGESLRLLQLLQRL